MKEKIRKIIILLFIITILCVIALLVVSTINNSKTADYSKDSEGIEDFMQVEIKNTIEYEQNKNIYYTLVSIVTNYIDTASIKDASLLDMFNSEFSTKYGVNKENINEVTGIPFLENDFEYYIFKPETIYSADEGKITTHFIKGYYYNVSTMENKKDISIMIELDTVNQTFNIYNYNYMKDNGYDAVKIGETYISNKTEIENRQNNIFRYVNYSEEEMANRYLKDYKDLILYNRTKAFEILDEEYAKLKFKDQEAFNNFAESKKIEIFKVQLDEYKVSYAENGNKVYICKDQNGNYYSFEETDGIMIYKAILDDYIIVNDEYVKKYNALTEQQKVAVNIDKFMKAINDKSYNYAYNCLADSFKNNYFKTQEEFETYVKSNFYESNSVIYNNFEKQGELYTYSVTITNEQTKEQKSKKFIVQLGEETEFVLSFDR